MTDADRAATSDCIVQLRRLARRSVHESRNALNGLVVNLEVVRSRLARADDKQDVLTFAEQAAEQSEESVKLTEGVGALLSLVLGSVDDTGRLRCSRISAGLEEIRLVLEPGVAERVLLGLGALGRKTGFMAEMSGAETIILSFPEHSIAESRKHE